MVNVLYVRLMLNQTQTTAIVFVTKDIICPMGLVILVRIKQSEKQPKTPVIQLVLKILVCGVHIKAIIIVSIVIMPQVHMLGLPKKNVTIVRTGISKTVAVHCVQRVNSPMQTERIVNNTKKSPKIGDFILWRARQDSNLQPSDP